MIPPPPSDGHLLLVADIGHGCGLVRDGGHINTLRPTVPQSDSLGKTDYRGKGKVILHVSDIFLQRRAR